MCDLDEVSRDRGRLVLRNQRDSYQSVEFWRTINGYTMDVMNMNILDEATAQIKERIASLKVDQDGSRRICPQSIASL